MYSRCCRSWKVKDRCVQTYLGHRIGIWSGLSVVQFFFRSPKIERSICRVERVSPSIEAQGIPLLRVSTQFTGLYTLFLINETCCRFMLNFSLNRRTGHDLDQDHSALNLPLLWRICTVRLQPRKCWHYDILHVLYRRSCRWCGSHPATWGRSYRSGVNIPWKI